MVMVDRMGVADSAIGMVVVVDRMDLADSAIGMVASIDVAARGIGDTSTSLSGGLEGDVAARGVGDTSTSLSGGLEGTRMIVAKVEVVGFDTERMEINLDLARIGVADSDSIAGIAARIDVAD